MRFEIKIIIRADEYYDDITNARELAETIAKTIANILQKKVHNVGEWDNTDGWHVPYFNENWQTECEKFKEYTDKNSNLLININENEFYFKIC